MYHTRHAMILPSNVLIRAVMLWTSHSSIGSKLARGVNFHVNIDQFEFQTAYTKIVVYYKYTCIVYCLSEKIHLGVTSLCIKDC